MKVRTREKGRSTNGENTPIRGRIEKGTNARYLGTVVEENGCMEIIDRVSAEVGYWQKCSGVLCDSKKGIYAEQ